MGAAPLGVEYLRRYDFAQVKPSELPVSIDDPTGRALVEEPFASRLSEPPLGSEIADTAFNSERPGALDAQLEEMMGDAPVCDVCGHITVRNGACYKCLNCGNSLGCS